MSMYSRRRDYFEKKRRDKTPGYQDRQNSSYESRRIGEDNFSGCTRNAHNKR
jgi:hypothetical protein